MEEVVFINQQTPMNQLGQVKLEVMIKNILLLELVSMHLNLRCMEVVVQVLKVVAQDHLDRMLAQVHVHVMAVAVIVAV